MKKTSLRSPLLLLLTAVIWGVAFVAQSVGMDYVGGFTFNCVRSIIGGAVLIPCIFFLDRWKVRDAKKSSSETAAGSKRSSLSAENQSNKSVTAAVKKGNRPEKAGNSVEEKRHRIKHFCLAESAVVWRFVLPVICSSLASNIQPLARLVLSQPCTSSSFR